MGASDYAVIVETYLKQNQVSTSDCEFWGDVTMQYTSTRERKSLVDLVRCERCAVGIHPACAVDYSGWSGKVGEPGGYYDRPPAIG